MAYDYNRIFTESKNESNVSQNFAVSEESPNRWVAYYLNGIFHNHKKYEFTLIC